MGKSQPNSRIKPRMYVRRSFMVEKSCILLARTGVRKISSIEYVFSSIKIHYSINRMNECLCLFYSKIAIIMTMIKQ